jgi:3-phenylpropionate/cinnamic acid dioxygenase small subunit
MAKTIAKEAPATAVDMAEIEAFLVHEADLLDERRFDEWRDLFDEDGYYWVPLHPGQENPEDEVSLFYDDRKTMETRFARLNHPRIHAQSPPTRTCRIVGNARIEDDTGTDGLTVASKMILVDYRQGEQRLFAGKVRHRLRRTANGFRIAWKKVELINCDDVLGVIAIPF